jgi:hypothetical protein
VSEGEEEENKFEVKAKMHEVDAGRDCTMPASVRHDDDDLLTPIPFVVSNFPAATAELMGIRLSRREEGEEMGRGDEDG